MGEKLICVQVIHLVTLQDRKERSQATGFSYHNARLGGRWGWASAHDPKLVTCEKCHKHRLKTIDGSCRVQNCRACYDWDHTKAKHEVGKEYPSDNIKQKVGRKISFGEMKAASIAAYDNLHGNGRQKWNAKNVREYLKEEGLNEPLIKDIIKCVSKDEMLKILPPCWNTDGDVNNHIETIMHLVFLGVSQTVGKVLKETMTAFNQFAAFHNNDNELRNIRSLQLDWCKTWIFGSQKLLLDHGYRRIR